MFRRKKDNEDGLPPAGESTEASGADAPKVFPRAAGTPAAPAASTSSNSSASSARPAVGAVPLRPSMPGTAPRSGADSGAGIGEKKLIVGREIQLSGQITSCDKLVVEGRVDANLSDSRSIDIAESGFFKGKAEIDSAEIAGRFEGTLTVRQRMFIRATGKVVGTIRYGMIEIEPGGEISGDVQVAGGARPATQGSSDNPPPGLLGGESNTG
jgi:cytoskeletal protein CcmA (bactofilin family)